MERDRDEQSGRQSTAGSSDRGRGIVSLPCEDILQGMGTGIVVLDRAWRYTFINDKALELLGKQRHELLGRVVWEAYPDLAGADIEAAYRKVMDERAPVSFERFHSPLNVWLDLYVYPVDDGIALQFTDVTGRKRAEQERERLIADLERSNRELEQFAYVSSHDLQEPLRMVASYVQLLEKKYKGKLDEQADKYITYAVEGAVRMQKLIEGLLQYSRIATRGADFRPVDMNKVSDSAVANLTIAIRESRAAITKDDLPTVLGDETQLIQLLQNLIGNAMKFRKPDVPPAVHVSAKSEAGEWVFSVSDNGIGIKPEHFDRIFLIFQRLHTRQEHPGTGIGLALCKRIVERHHGRIWVKSTPREGTTFFFTIPLAAERR